MFVLNWKHQITIDNYDIVNIYWIVFFISATDQKVDLDLFRTHISSCWGINKKGTWNVSKGSVLVGIPGTVRLHTAVWINATNWHVKTKAWSVPPQVHHGWPTAKSQSSAHANSKSLLISWGWLPVPPSCSLILDNQYYIQRRDFGSTHIEQD